MNKSLPLLLFITLITVIVSSSCGSASPTATETPTTSATITPSATATTSTTVTDTGFQADGIISQGEYTYQQVYGNYELNWSNDADSIYIGMKAKTTGFVALGIQPGFGMQNADIIFGIVKDGQAEVYDMFSIGVWGPHPQDTELGGTSDITEFGGAETDGYTIIEFKRALNTNDASYDTPLTKGINAVIWSFGSSDNLSIQHSTKGYGEVVID